jgi:chlorite dismutase
MLADHGMAARSYKDVRANTVPAFALGDYEWILAFEAAELHRIVDLMRDLRATEARLHVREEIPFFTGPRVGVEELIARLP